MENAIMQWAMNFGIGAVFACVMFFVYRETIKQMRQDRKYMEDCMREMTDRYDETIREYTRATIENTKVSSELLTYLKAKNGNRR